MSRGVPRWGRLTVFALLNLVFWLTVAGATGLLVSDEVDIGAETFVRQAQATAVTLLEQAATGVPDGAPKPTTSDRPSQPEVVSPTQSRPRATAIWPDTPTAESTAPETSPQTIASPRSPTPALTPSQGSAPAGPTPEPQETRVRSPLLMTDPQLDAATSVDQEMSRSAVGRPVQIRYSEAALNREIAALLQRNPNLPYKNVELTLHRDHVIITGTSMLLGFQVGTQIVTTLSVKDCRPVLEIESISLAGVLTPPFAKEQIQNMVEDALTWYPEDHPLCLQHIVIENGRVMVYGIRR